MSVLIGAIKKQDIPKGHRRLWRDLVTKRDAEIFSRMMRNVYTSIKVVGPYRSKTNKKYAIYVKK